MAVLKSAFELVCLTLQSHGIDYVTPYLIIRAIKAECQTPELVFRALLDLMLSLHGLSTERRADFLNKKFTLADLLFFLENDLQLLGFPFGLAKSLKKLDSYALLDQPAMICAILYICSVDGRFVELLHAKFKLEKKKQLQTFVGIRNDKELQFLLSKITRLVGDIQAALPFYRAAGPSLDEYKAALTLQTFYQTLDSLFKQLEPKRYYGSFRRFHGAFQALELQANDFIEKDDLAETVDFVELNRRLAAKTSKQDLLIAKMAAKIESRMNYLLLFRKSLVSV